MANADAPKGLTPVRHVSGSPYNGQVERCFIPDTDNTDMFVGDAVKSAGSADANGVRTIAQAAAGNTLLGVIVGFDPNPDDLSLTYRKGGVAQYAYVATDPALIFEVQEDSVGGALAAADIGLNANLVVAAGSKVSGLSGMQLDTSTKATTATLPLRILGLVQREDNAFGAKAKVEVKINLHEYTSTTGV